LKILQVVPFFTPARGGSVIVPYHLSKELATKGHEITVITTDFEFDKDYANSLEEEGVNVVHLHCIANIGLFLFSPGMKKWLRNNIKKFDIIHMHNYRSYQNNVVYRFAKKFDVPYILQAHGSILPFFAKQRLKKLYDWVWGYKLLKYTSKVIALTTTESQQYKKMGVNEDKIEIVPNGINPSKYNNLPKRGEFRSKYSIGRDEKIILYLGRIHKIKGIDLLVQSFADLTMELDNVRLVIVGPDDGYLSTLIKIIKHSKIDDKVIFTGPLYETDKLEAYVDADVYVLPSMYETFPMTVLEACACGTPVIVTDRCGIADIVDGKVGYVVEFDKDQLGDAILELLGSDDLRAELGGKGKKLMKEEFGWDGIVRKVEKIYEKVI
jgi:glycosyltransferase involved in cell wall biosynthesis